MSRSGTRLRAAAVSTLGLALSACGKAPHPDAPPTPPATAPTRAEPPAPSPSFADINAFVAAGTPTFIVGSDPRAKAQATFARDHLFPTAKILDAAQVTTWPEHALVYGGPHTNPLLAPLALPFTMTADTLTVGGETFAGSDLRLIALVPADSGPPAHPPFVLYAGTGATAIAEINAVPHGPQAIVVADAFGVLATGTWTQGTDGRPAAKLGPRARRIAWRTVGPGGHFRFPAQLPATPDDDALVAAGERGIAQSVAMLGLADAQTATADLAVYVYPDPRSKRTLTGDAGAGHAVIAGRALHVLRVDPSVGGDFEHLMAHEATHLLAYAAWGPAGSSFMGEGLAVWVSGTYAGTPLAEFAREERAARARAVGARPVPAAPPRARDLLGPAFRAAPERETYPLAGLFVQTAVALVGRDNLRAHLFGATAATWDAACRAAGTTPEALEEAFARTIATLP